MNSTANQVGQSAKTLAQQIAKQMAQEPLEILKDAREQTTGETLSDYPDHPSAPKENTVDEQKKLAVEQGKLNDQIKSGHRMEALQREIDDIRKQKLFSELQRRISQGERIPLEEYSDLSMDQKQVLNAQMEAVKAQIYRQQLAGQGMGVPAINSKPSRRFGAGQKQQAQKEQTRVEKPVPPSG